MSIRRMIGVSGILMVLSMLTMSLPGCGGSGGQESSLGADVKGAPIVNPAPGAVPAEEEYKYMNPDGTPKKAK